MRCIFRYCFNCVLSRNMGFNKLAAFPSSNVNFTRLRCMLRNSWDIEKPALKHDEPITEEDSGPVEITSQPIYTRLSGLANNYKILQNLVDLGVDIRCFEKDLRMCGSILKFDFETHVVPYLKFLIQHGVPEKELGNFITANPNILFSDLDDLQVRVNYLYSKAFDKNMIATIITKNPKWLSYEVIYVDKLLGALQEIYRLPGCKVREIVVKYPSILKVRLSDIRFKWHTFKNVFCLDKKTIQSLVVETPKLLQFDQNTMMATYYYLKDVMLVSQDVIMAQPKILTYRQHFLQTKHLFLKQLGKDQYNPKLPGYVSLMDLAESTDEEFAEKIARSSFELYINFQKTL